MGSHFPCIEAMERGKSLQELFSNVIVCSKLNIGLEQTLHLVLIVVSGSLILKLIFVIKKRSIWMLNSGTRHV